MALATRVRIRSSFDYVVIGGGISGLLAAYRIKKADPRRSVLVCEADRWGGRAYSYDWHGALIKLGAGIIRGRDHKLLALCKELGLKVGQFNSTVSYRWKDPKPLSQAEIPGLVKRVTDIYEQNRELAQSLSFEEFLTRFVPEKTLVIRHLGYTDMLKASTPDVIYNYQFQICL